MNFGGFLDIIGGGDDDGDARFTDISGFSNDMTSGAAVSQPRLSLALQTNMEGQIADTFESNNVCGTKRRSREEDNDSRSVSDNLEDGVSGDDHDGSDNKTSRKKKKKKRYHRHTPQQIQELEGLFKECPHPDEKQRLELSRRLNLETRQVKFWFQNRRTQMKTQIERHQNSLLRQDNDRLQAENMSIREAMRNPICENCGGPAMMGDLSFEEQHLRIENARLKEEFDRVCGLAGKFLRRPDLVNSSFNDVVVPPMGSSQIPLHLGPVVGSEFGIGVSNSFSTLSSSGNIERTMYLEIALAAMDELVKMARTDEPLWVMDMESGRDVLNHAEYLRMFTPCIHGLKPNGFVTEASRENDLVMINSLALVEILMDSNRWAEMFPCMIAKANTRDIISSGMCGTRNGAIVLIQAEIQVVSPLVGVREVNFLRFCKQHSEGVWAVVDVSVQTSGAGAAIGEASASPFSCRRLPSGCIVQDMPNGYSKVTWIEHADYDESNIHRLYKPLIRSGMGFGARPWLATLRRQCQCLAILISSTLSNIDQTDGAIINPVGKRSMLKLAQRMTHSFCAAVCESATSYKWNKLSATNVGEDVRVMTRKSVDDPGEPPGVVLSAATSVWLPISTQRLFDFLREARFRSEWDILSNGGPMEEIANICKAQDHGNCVSLLRANAVNENQSSSNSMLILQETCTDAAGSLVVYAPVDVPAMHAVMNGGDSAYVALLPSGFGIMPDGGGTHYGGRNNEKGSGGGSLLTVAFQILVNSLPTAKLTVESVETVNHLISCTVDRIKSALSL
ncbi:homeobox-leucine zipper protein ANTHOCYANINLESS 2-like isoform X2 [Impatiens glandulifera]|uniref:homeobox-leucine zipper protein ANTHOCYANINLESS 2-like isoform X2 n=1 Tax=Impatiens glandulifera TaxID=253017 RepID=UPI001FB15CD4|nr:homeobox-leucine zipper protein ANTHOCYANINLESS 2-like isoform X2 [Impatiens glandulifera]